MKYLFLILLIAGLILLGLLFPLAQIWALNTLFPALTITYNIWTWLAVLIFNISWFSKIIFK